MKTLLFVLVFGIALVAPAEASCRVQTITLPDGRSMICTTCCYGSYCDTWCS